MNRNQLKILAAAAMLLDHIALAFLPQTGAAYFMLRFFGRITGPVMAYFVAEGYRYTSNVKRYALRLFAFSLVAWPAFCFFETGRLPVQLLAGHGVPDGWLGCNPAVSDLTLAIYPHFSVLHTLLLGLLAVWLWDKGRCARWCRALGVIALCVLALPGDWSFYNVLFVLLFFIKRDSPNETSLAFSLLAAMMILTNTASWYDLYRLGMFLVPPLIQFCYNGLPGRRTAIGRWGFYTFYPAHLFLLGFLRF